MTRLVTLLVALVMGAVALGVIAPALAHLAEALTAPIVAAGVVVAVLRVLWFFTR